MNLRVFFGAAFWIGISSFATAAEGFNFETAGKSVERVLEELSKSGNQTLKASPRLAKDVLAIRVANGSLDALKAEIARIEHADWVERSNGQILVQSPKDIKKEIDFHRAALIQAFAVSIRAQGQALDAQPPFDAHGATLFGNTVEKTLSLASDPERYALALQSLEPLSPNHRAIVRMLTAFRPEELAQLPLRIKVTYSNLPTAAQRELPDTALPAVSQYLDEQTLWAQEAAAHTFLAPSRNGVSFSLPSFVANLKRPSGTPAKVLLSLYRETEFGRLIAELKLANSDGQILEQASASLSLSEHEASSIKDSSVGGHPVIASEQALQLTGLAGKPISEPELRQTLLHPETVDPLSVAYGSTLIQIAKDEGVNLIAVLSDRFLDGGLRQYRFDAARQYFASMAKKGQQSELDGDWLAVSPEDSAWDREDRADRVVLGEYVRGATSQRFPVEEQAECALNLPDPMENMMPAALVGRLQNRMVALRDSSLLRFYGSLSSEDRKRAANSEGLHLAELSNPASMEYLNEIVYGRTTPLIIPRNSRPDLWREPSECLANGLDRASVLHLSIKTEDSVFDLDKDKSPFQMSEGAVTAGEVAFSEFQRSHPERNLGAPVSSSNPNAPHFQLGDLKTYVFDFRLAPDVSTNGMLESRSLADGDPLTLNELPGSFLAEVAKSLVGIERAEAIVRPNGLPKQSTSSGTP